MSGILKVGGSELINDNGGSGSLQWGTGVPAGTVIQTVIDSDATTYANTSFTSGPTNEIALSKAYSITPTSSSNKILAHFTIPQVRLTINVAGLYIKIYRKIGSGSYAHLTEASGDNTGTPEGAFAGNYDRQGDGNRSSLWLGGVFSDTSHGQSGVEVSYKFYFGSGDGSSPGIYVNRTENDNNANYNFRTRTHCTLQEIKG